MELDVLLPREVSERKGKMEMVKLLRAMLKELGFSKGGVKQIGGEIYTVIIFDNIPGSEGGRKAWMMFVFKQVCQVD